MARSSGSGSTEPSVANRQASGLRWSSPPTVTGAVADLAIVLLVTTRDRGWPHHVPLNGRELSLQRPSFAMTEQPHTISRRRISRRAGSVDEQTMHAITRWIENFLAL